VTTELGYVIWQLVIPSPFYLILWYLFTLANLSVLRSWSLVSAEGLLCCPSDTNCSYFLFCFLPVLWRRQPINISEELRPLSSRMWCHWVRYFDTNVSEEITASFFKFQERVFNDEAVYKASCRTTLWPLTLPAWRLETSSARRNIIPEAACSIHLICLSSQILSINACFCCHKRS